MMDKGWFDNFSNKEIDRTIDSDGIVSYSTLVSDIEKIDTDKTFQNLELLEVYFITLKSSKKTLTPELKRVIDDLNESTINGIWGQTDYTQKTPLGHAIDEMNVETVEYLIQKGVDVNKSGTNQKHILQELLASNATDKRVKILEIVLENLNPDTIKLTKGFDDKFYSIKYLVPLLNSNQISEDDVEYLYGEVTPKQKKTLIENCERFASVEKENILRESLSQEIKDIFFI